MSTDKGYWIEATYQEDIFGDKVLFLTANLTPYGYFDEADIRKEAKKELNAMEREFKGKCVKKTQIAPDFSPPKELAKSTVKDKASLGGAPK